MKFILILFVTLLLNFSLFADLLKPSSNLKPYDVIKIQLNALMLNNTPYEDAGIEQTWEFAHPQNRKYTGPLSKFTKMMKSNSYSLMIDHLSHNIIIVSENDLIANYFIELTDKSGSKYGFTWIVEKVLIQGQFQNSWMTTSVSKPLSLAKSA